MRIWLFALLTIAMAGCSGPANRVPTPQASMSMTVASTAFVDGAHIPSRYTCDGADVSPPLRVAGVPSGARQLAILVEDPDAPGGTFVHWVAWGLDPARSTLAEGEAPPGSGVNGFGRRGYSGPCPPKGAPHRYLFTVFALSRPLSLSPGASADDLRTAVSGTVLAEGRLIGRYGR